MNTKIQDLTRKIYQEGIEKGNIEAQQIVAEARKQEEAIVKEAQAQADKIVAEAQKRADDLKKNTEAELKLFAGQALSVLKSEITNLLCKSVINNTVSPAAKDAAFMQQFLLTLATEWTKKEAITIETTEAKALTAFFGAKAKELLDKGVKIEQVNGKKSSFAIAPANGSYKITIGEEEFKAYFEEFLRPQLVNMLFA